MLDKIAIIIYFVAILQPSKGVPLETARPGYDVSRFFSNRIVGGVDAPDGHAPHMVALIIGHHFRSLVCGASIITTRHVITAAHCIDPFVHWGELYSSFIGVIGTNYWNSTKTEIKFSHHVNHPGWDWNTIKNDIGLLITVKEIHFTNRVGPIAVNCDWMDGGQLGYVTGWGRLGAWHEIPVRLQLLYVWTLSPLQCFQLMEKAKQILGPAPAVDPKVEICTFHSIGHGMCMGDSGSALVIREKYLKFLVGMVSWGYPCALGAPDVHTRISGFKPWLQKHVGKDICRRA